MRNVIVFILVLAAGALGIYYFDPDVFSTVFSGLQGGLSALTGGNLSYSEIQGYASAAGFTGDDLDTATAIALAESSGNPNAAGDATKGGSYGLWQINLAAHPEYTAEELYDPQTNANAAYVVYSSASNGFSPWTTFNNGAYQAYLQGDSSSQVASNSGDSTDSSGDDSSDEDDTDG
jgi:soluble lytic murein transglycosylase-like protein